MNIMIVIRKDMMMIMKRAVIITLKPDGIDGKVFKDYFFIIIILIMVFTELQNVISFTQIKSFIPNFTP